MLKLDDEILNQELDETLKYHLESILNGDWCDVDRFYDFDDIIKETFEA